MSDKWTIRGKEFSNCNCAYGCPCQFGSPTTHGNCEAIGSVEIEEGHFNDTRLDGLYAVMLLYWPGEIADGNGKQQMIIDERADAEQREALRKILHGQRSPWRCISWTATKLKAAVVSQDCLLRHLPLPMPSSTLPVPASDVCP